MINQSLLIPGISPTFGLLTFSLVMHHLAILFARNIGLNFCLLGVNDWFERRFHFHRLQFFPIEINASEKFMVLHLMKTVYS